tara:strand:- start:31212 stop:32246 length:1035 start_codon:yes stop_codon:yes gene_type:complete
VGTLPVANQFESFINSFLSFINGCKNTSHSENIIQILEDRRLTETDKHFVRILNKLKEQLNKKITFDQIIRNNNNIRHIKQYSFVFSLCMSFFHETNINKKEFIDKRYIAFFSTMLVNRKMRENVKILNWNYDYMLEDAYIKLFDDTNFNDLEEIRDVLGIKNKFMNPSNEGSIYRLNGSIGYTDKMRRGEYDFHSHKFNSDLKSDDNLAKKVYIEMLEKYKYTLESFDTINSLLSFSWEENNDFLNLVKKSTKQTEKLIIIGYSFPFFNKTIDKAILWPIIENSFNLDIVIQDMEPVNVKKKLLETLEKTEHMLVNNYNVTFSLMEIRENNDNFYISNNYINP